MRFDVEIREATDSREDVEAIFDLLQGLHAEVGLAPLHRLKAVTYILERTRDPKSSVLMAEVNGTLVASASLVMNELWYSDEDILVDDWFYIAPDHRDGRVLRAMLTEITAICRQAGRSAVLVLNNPRRGRPARSTLESIGDVIRIDTGGTALLVQPRAA